MMDKKTVFCITAGTQLSDILWIANILPFLSGDLMELIWECPSSGIQQLLHLYPKLDQTVNDVEELLAPPDVYLIVHPFWSPASASIQTPLQAVFSIISPWCVIPSALPDTPYPIRAKLERPSGCPLPPRYLCIDPSSRSATALDPKMIQLWIQLITYLSIPAVQIGRSTTPLVPHLLDARGLTESQTAAVLANSLLFLGSDSDYSCLASALDKPQIWVNLPKSNWWWPRNSANVLVCNTESPSSIDLLALVAWAWERLNMEKP
jgi:hypothetical protein